LKLFETPVKSGAEPVQKWFPQTGGCNAEPYSGAIYISATANFS